MKKFTFAKIASLVFVCAMLFCALAVTAFATDDTVEIVSNNMYFGEKYQLMYAVNAPEGATVTAKDSKGNAIDVVTFAEAPTATVNGVECNVYILAEGVAAQAIDEVITFTVEYNGVTASSNYSVLQYVYERLNVKNIAVDAEKAMFEAFLTFADAANVWLDKETGSFNDYVYVAAEGVTVNGVNPTGMYKAGDKPFANVELALDFDEANQVLRWYLDGELSTLDAIKAVEIADKAVAVEAVVLDKCHDGHTWVDPTCQADGYCEVCDAEGDPAVDCKDEDGDYKCDFDCGTIIEPEADSALTVEQAIALGNLFAHNTYSTNSYYVTGIIDSVYNATYGNAYLATESGDKFTVYGMYDYDGNRYDALTYKPAKGDEITIYGQIGAFNDAPQMKNGTLDEIVAHEHNNLPATCTEAGVCTICDMTIEQKLDHNYVDGFCEGCGAEEPAAGTVVVNKADFDTVSSTNTSYGSATTTSGWKAENSAVLSGAASGNTSPKFVFISTDTAVKAFTLNGKTTGIGKITSPTLAGGVSRITFNYGLPFSDNKIGLTIKVIQNGEVVATNTISNSSAAKYTAYTFEWDLDTVVVGEFTIEIVNNCPSNSTSNKDRTAIWNLEWTSAPAN